MSICFQKLLVFTKDTEKYTTFLISSIQRCYRNNNTKYKILCLDFHPSGLSVYLGAFFWRGRWMLVSISLGLSWKLLLPRRSLLWLDPSQHLKIHKLDTFLLFYKKSVCFTGKSNVGSNLHSLSLVDGWILVGSHTARLPLDARAAVLKISQHKDVIRASRFIILCMLTREEKSQWKFQSQKKSQFQWSHRGS